MSTVLRTGRIYQILDEKEVEICNPLPAQNYTVGFDQMKGTYFLETIDDFSIPSKLYGNTQKQAERVLNTFEQRSGATGVQLDGVKGSGKTLLAKYISVMAREKSIPTIVVNQPFHGDVFNKFIQGIKVPAVIIFDEFEKVYGWGEQEKILTLLDGVYPTKKLFIVTSNESSNVNLYMKNRPGRLFYSFKFDTLASEFVEEYCRDNLKDQSQVESVVRYTKVFSFFNFDMLAAAVEEMNRYGETLQEVLDVLNIEPEVRNGDTYRLTLKAGTFSKVLEENYRGFTPNDFSYYVRAEDELSELKSTNSELYNIIENSVDDEGDLLFKSDMIAGYDPARQAFTFSGPKAQVGIELVVEKEENKANPFNMSLLF